MRHIVEVVTKRRDIGVKKATLGFLVRRVY